VHDRFVFIVLGAVLALTVMAGVGAVGVGLFGPAPPTLFSERLFDTFVHLATAGFFALLGLLAGYGHSVSRSPGG
jgi:hypothetical protein